LNVKEAAKELLKQASSSLHAKEITEKIIATGLWISEGKTPETTVSASLYSDIKKNGDKSAFVKVGPQTFALWNSSAKPTDVGVVPPDVQEATKPLSVNAGFSFTDCAQKVLEEFGGKKPLNSGTFASVQLPSTLHGRRFARSTQWCCLAEGAAT